MDISQFLAIGVHPRSEMKKNAVPQQEIITSRVIQARRAA
jgi:hypothetical protein